VTLFAAMVEAQSRDRIAWQYAHDYNDIFEFGLQRYRETATRWQWTAWATTSVYLGFLARFPDTHIARKYGDAMALEIQREARVHDDALLAQDNPKLVQRTLLDFDRELKARGINPGTSADLTVATLLAAKLEKMVTGRALS
jgi:triphosphoribosyl-dephospho-CoA synthase